MVPGTVPVAGDNTRTRGRRAVPRRDEAWTRWSESLPLAGGRPVAGLGRGRPAAGVGDGPRQVERSLLKLLGEAVQFLALLPRERAGIALQQQLGHPFALLLLHA